MQLLLRGYRVRGTVRDLSRPESFAYLSRLQNAAENLELVEANLMSQSSCLPDLMRPGALPLISRGLKLSMVLNMSYTWQLPLHIFFRIQKMKYLIR
jgi:hypothetical protein